jgi:hypothetical protein
VVTVPLNTLGAIHFEPSLSEVKRSAIALGQAGIGSKVMLKVRTTGGLVSGMHPKMTSTGNPIDLGELYTRAQKMGARVGLDTSGPELKHWARSGFVNLIKPNADELASLVGRDLHTLGEAIDAGRELVAVVELGFQGRPEAFLLGVVPAHPGASD